MLCIMHGTEFQYSMIHIKCFLNIVCMSKLILIRNIIVDICVLSLFISELISVLDMQYDFMPQGYFSLVVLAAIWTIGIITTIVLGIRHFRKVRRIKKQKGKM